MIVASGMTVVMITGGIDISVGSVVGLDCMILAFYMEKMGMPAGIAILIVLAFGVLFGAFQGWLISYMELQPFVITLAGLFFCRGLTAIISSQQIAITKSAFFLGLANKNIIPAENLKQESFGQSMLGFRFHSSLLESFLNDARPVVSQIFGTFVGINMGKQIGSSIMTRMKILLSVRR